MKAVRRVLNVLILLAAANVLFLLTYFGFGPVGTGMFLALLAGLVFIAVRPMAPTAPTKRIRRLANGCELLRLFLSNPGMAFTREQLFAQVWNTEYMGESRTLDMHIRTLRQKLGPYGKMIETVRNVGYRLEVAQ